MARRYKLRDLEKEKGNLEELIIGLLNQCGGKQHIVAAKLNLSQATISQFLSKNGYVARTIYTKEQSTACPKHS